MERKGEKEGSSDQDDRLPLQTLEVCYILLVGLEHGSAREHVGISWRGLFGSDIG